MLEHVLLACKISQFDYKLVTQITFEIDCTGYTLYYMQGFQV